MKPRVLFFGSGNSYTAKLLEPFSELDATNSFWTALDWASQGHVFDLIVSDVGSAVDWFQVRALAAAFENLNSEDVVLVCREGTENASYLADTRKATLLPAQVAAHGLMQRLARYRGRRTEPAPPPT